MIGYGMLYAVAIGVPILAAVTIGSGVLQRQGRAQRGAWLGALVLALLLPLLLLATPAAEQPTSVPSPVASTGLVGLPTVVSVATPAPVTVPIAQSALGVDEILLGLWALGSLMLALRWIVASVRLGRMTRSLEEKTIDGVPVALTADLGPAVAGVLSPRILAPAWLLELPASQRALVLLHEAEHIRAGDPWLLFTSRLARVLAPWNPVVWLLSARLVRAIELDCDRRVLSRHPDVGTYGTTLLSISSRTSGPIVPAAAFAETDGPLRQRILAMTTPPRTVSLLGLSTALILGVLLIVGVFEVPIPALRVQADVEPVAAPESGTDGPGTDMSAADAYDSGGITGVVTDRNNKRPLQYVQVYVPGTGIGTLTNEQGEYRLTGVPAGERRIVAEYIGHESAEQSVTVIAGDVAALDLDLRQIAIELSHIVVADRGSEAPGAERPLVYVDGVRIADAAGTDFPYVPGLDPDDIERVEVIKGGAAEALFGEEAAGGVIQILLKSESAAETPADRSIGSTPGQPIFTPWSVAPTVLNQDEVQRAIVEAYPVELREDGIGGTVEVYFFVDEEGAVQDYRIDSSSGHQALDDAALAVASVYRFSPALNRDAPVAVWVSFPITFLQMR